MHTYIHTHIYIYIYIDINTHILKYMATNYLYLAKKHYFKIKLI